jgi:hypothetical protein
MKKLLFVLMISCFSGSLFAQTVVTSPVKKVDEFLKFKELKFNFGKIKQGTPVTHEFPFTNVSKELITIETATASCGCTTPQWPQAPISKGKTDKITAGFNAAAAGPFSKEIYVKVKGFDSPLSLNITGEVLTAEAFSKLEAEKKN